MVNAGSDSSRRWRRASRRRRATVVGTGAARVGRRRLAGVGAPLVVALVVALTACSSGGSGGGSGGAAGPTGAETPVATASAVGPGPTTGPSTGTSTGGTVAPGGPATARVTGLGAAGSGYQPLFPFASLAQADEWRRAYGAGGTQPWHLDPSATATAFTAHLGLTGVHQALNARVSGPEARVTVGFTLPAGGGRTGSAAVVHLVRFGTAATAPWEVVGTDDTTFSLTAPRYGGVGRSPLAVGGRITGVDESIRVTVFGLASSRPLGTSCCVAAGGDSTPWRAAVRFTAPAGTVLTVLATTGGHLTAVERFAVTAVRTS